MPHIPPEIPVRRITLKRKINPEKGWSEWCVSGDFFPNVEDAVLAYYIDTGEFGGLRTTYKAWHDAINQLARRLKGKRTALSEALRSMEPRALRALRVLMKSTDRRGAPDLLLRNVDGYHFAEVKRMDSLSREQRAWALGMMQAGVDVFVVKVKSRPDGEQLSKDEFITGKFEEAVAGYIAASDDPTPAGAYAHAKRALTGFGGFDIESTLDFESRIHKLYGGDGNARMEETFRRLLHRT